MDSTQTVNSSSRRRLGALISEQRDEVVRRWLIRVKREHRGRELSEPELEDSVPDYLDALADALGRSETGNLSDRGGREWEQIARKRVVTRVHLGFDVTEVIREFRVLRQELLSVIGERAELSALDVECIVDLIGGAIADATKSYVESRDYERRKQQAQHIGFLTHELRNPLTTAMAAVGMIRKEGASNPRLGRSLEMLESSLRRLRDLIDKALLEQRLEAAAVEAHPVEVSLGELMHQALEAAQMTTSNKGVVFHASYDPDVRMLVDRDLALSAIQNVVDNAAKFTDRGQVDLEVEEQSDEIVVHVRDECEGLAPEELLTIFEPFKRGHQGKSGTGLGMAIARRAVEAHGKSIHAESDGARGCHFWFALPRAVH